MKKFIRSFCLSAILCTTTTAIFADDLWQTYLQAYANDPIYKAAVAQYLAEKENLPIKRAVLLPAINLTAAVNRQRVNQSAENPGLANSTNSYYNTENQYTLTVTQPIFNYSAWAAVKNASASVKQSEAKLFTAQQDLIMRVAKAYFAVLEAKDNLAYLEAQRVGLARQLARAKQQFAVGVIAITDVDNAEAGYDTATASAIAARNTLSNSLVELKALTNKSYTSLLGIGKQLPLVVPHPDDMGQWLQTAEKQNYGLLASRFAAQAAQANIKQQFAGHLPEVNATAGYNIDDDTNSGGRGNNGFLHQNAATIGLSVSLPVYQGGSVTAETRQASYLYQQAISQMEQTHRAVQTQTSEAYLGILSTISKIKADKEAVISSRSSLAATEAAYSVGTRTIIDVLNAETTLYQAKSTYSQDEYNYLINILSLKQAAGTLSPADLQQLNSWLSADTDVHVVIKTTLPSMPKKTIAHTPNVVPGVIGEPLERIPGAKPAPQKTRNAIEQRAKAEQS